MVLGGLCAGQKGAGRLAGEEAVAESGLTAEIISEGPHGLPHTLSSAPHTDVHARRPPTTPRSSSSTTARPGALC